MLELIKLNVTLHSDSHTVEINWVQPSAEDAFGSQLGTTHLPSE